jgi:hypothetical protein
MLMLQPGFEHQDIPQLVLSVPSLRDVFDPGLSDRARIEEPLAL